MYSFKLSLVHAFNSSCSNLQCEQSKEIRSLGSNQGESSQGGRDNCSLGCDLGETSHAVGTHNTQKNPSNNSQLVSSPLTSSENLHEAHDGRSFPTDPATYSELFHQNVAREALKATPQINATAELKEKMTLRSGAAPAEAELDILLNMINETKENNAFAFETVTAEAELDMLLDSFGETRLLNSVAISEELTNNFPGGQSESSATSLKESSAFLSAQPVSEVPDSFNHASLSDTLADAIDDLLAQTPIVSNQDHGAQYPLESLTSQGPPSSHHGPKALDDFDSWLDTL